MHISQRDLLSHTQNINLNSLELIYIYIYIYIYIQNLKHFPTFFSPSSFSFCLDLTLKTANIQTVSISFSLHLSQLQQNICFVFLSLSHSKARTGVLPDFYNLSVCWFSFPSLKIQNKAFFLYFVYAVQFTEN